MTTLIQDLRYGLRMLAKSPGFTAVAILTLALGIGANTAMFSVVNGVLLNRLPYTEPERLVALYSRTPEFEKMSISYPNFLDWVRNNRSFSGLAAYRADNFNLTGEGEPERVAAEMISASLFPLLGVKPILGRTFTAEEDLVGAAPVVLITEGLWNRRFGSAPDVLSKSLTLNGTPYTIVGVIPASFQYSGNNFSGPKDVYVSIGQWNDPTFRDRKVGMGMDAVARLKPGVTFAQAKADMEALGRHLAEEYPEANKGTGISMFPLKQDIVGDIRPFLMVLLAAVGFVLLIACVNVANLLLARSTAREREFAVRTALGASRGRMVRQLLTESVLLATSGGLLGLLFSGWGTQAALKLLPEALPRTEEVQVDGRVLLFTLAVSILGGIMFGLAPALKAHHTDLHETLKEGGRGSSGARHRAQRVFVVVELALALILLASTGLMVRTLFKLGSVDLGFDPHNVLTSKLSSPTMGPTPEANRATWRLISERLNAIPGVMAASLNAGALPLGGDSEAPFWVEGQPKPLTQSEMKRSLFYLVQPDYLKALRIPLQRGRFIGPEDNVSSPLVTVIDDRFARLFFGNEDPVGKRVNFSMGNMTMPAEVVGVVGHVNQWGLDSDSRASVQAQSYFALSQMPDPAVPLIATHLGIVLRTEGSPSAQAGSIRQALEQINSQFIMFDMQTMEAIISNSLASRRFSMILLGIFSALALVMACVGIYGVISYLAGQRTHEIGIRMALGARRFDVLRMVLGEGARMALLGVAIGLAVAFGLTRLMERMLFGISAHDPATFVAVAFLLSAVAILASYIPARRATKVDPMIALRYE